MCEQTAHFEDFVLLFLDKVLILIENCSGAEATRADAATWGKIAYSQLVFVYTRIGKDLVEPIEMCSV